MALKKSIALDGNLLFVTSAGTINRGAEQIRLSDCYIKVESVSATKHTASASVSFTKDTIQIVKTYEFVPSLGSGNFIAQAYEHLKTLPEFTGSMDC